MSAGQLDVASDTLVNGRRSRLLWVVGTRGWSCPAIQLDHSLMVERVVRMLTRLKGEGGLPTVLQLDNGPEFTSRMLDRGPYEHGLKLHFIQLG